MKVNVSSANVNSKRVQVGLMIIGLVLVGVFALSDSGKGLFSEPILAKSTGQTKSLVEGVVGADSSYRDDCVSACNEILVPGEGETDCDAMCPANEPANGCLPYCQEKCSGIHDCPKFCSELCGKMLPQRGSKFKPEMAGQGQVCRARLQEILESNKKLVFKSLPKLMQHFPVSADATVILGNGKRLKMGSRRSVRGEDKVWMKQRFLSLRHKFASVEGKNPSVLMVFGDNTVVTANADPCEIDGVYYPRDGEINDAIAPSVRANLHVMEDSSCKKAGYGCDFFERCCGWSDAWTCHLKCGAQGGGGSSCVCK